MDCKIDYLSFTVDVPEELAKSQSDERIIANAIIEHIFSGDVLNAVFNGDWQVYQLSGNYRVRLMDSNSKISLSFSPQKPYGTIEISGQGMDIIRKCGLEDIILQLSVKRVTRIDLAVDFNTDCSPDQFLSNYQYVVFKGNSRIDEITGVTCYVGSWNSERFARVYKYNHPHPRSHLLRVEHVYKQNWAKSIVPYILSNGIVAACLAAGEAFQWTHPLWQRGDAQISKIQSPRTTPSQAGKYRWLVTQVAPAIRKARSEGWFDFELWLREHIYSE